jgi:hypothetical protein
MTTLRMPDFVMDAAINWRFLVKNAGKLILREVDFVMDAAIIYPFQQNHTPKTSPMTRK